VRLWKAYHPGTPKPRRTRAKSVVLVLTSVAFALAPATADAWLSEHAGSVHAAQAAAARPAAALNHPTSVANAQASKPNSAQAANQPVIRAEMTELLKLANELQADVNKTNKDMLSLAVVRKADAIEKLARSMKASQPMRGSGDH